MFPANGERTGNPLFTMSNLSTFGILRLGLSQMGQLHFGQIVPSRTTAANRNTATVGRTIALGSADDVPPSALFGRTAGGWRLRRVLTRMLNGSGVGVSHRTGWTGTGRTSHRVLRRNPPGRTAGPITAAVAGQTPRGVAMMVLVVMGRLRNRRQTK